MLKWSRGEWVPNPDRLFFWPLHDAVGNNAVVREVSAPDHISGTCGGDGRLTVRKEGATVTVRHQLRTGFAVGIGVKAVQRIRLPVSPLHSWL